MLVRDLQDTQEKASSALQEAKKKQDFYYKKAR
jgi:hypothetical protein